ncbi:MAG TPA: alpha-1,2-fucosyltransferase [Puia sp.]|nr:alpha-1,2-fucosyltransferase [Puia sp.]
MDVIIIFNGLGNQMSQYAFYLNKKNISKSTRFLFSKKSNNIHNGYELDRVFGIKYHDSLINKFLYLTFRIAGYKKYAFISKPAIRFLNFLGIKIINENDDYDFKSEYLRPSKGIKFYVGGWHSEKYFMAIKDTILKTFQFNPENIGIKNLQVLEQIKVTKSISVHVRRGDFIDSNNLNKLGNVCTLDYFLKAIEKMRSLVDSPHFFFFTNDYSWVQTNFNGPDFSLINLNTKSESWKDMFLISNCSHHINSNGSFSWWSSWLNNNSHPYVIVPKNFIANKYFKDIYPENWILLSDY